MGCLKMEAWMIIVLLALGFSSLDDHQILAEAKLWVRDLKQSPKRNQNIGRKETKAWWWSGDYSCVKKRRPVHNGLDP
ncbi:hypothetical protein MA16_Dca001628 [Dendrobium catenatum]|uniref:Uncharacterized protein n=1 Tax=Dendrobium catenatum TaxID=906689 RepID=A0A2I0WMX5_9ASPA|nr:hypothetical protein MA16_Dca001628 [Dendrobium catenatum]